MYLSNNAIFKFDNVVKAFEVAFRSYVADILLNNYPDIVSFENEINRLDSSYSPNSMIYTERLYLKIKHIKRNVVEYHKTISNVYDSYLHKQYDNVVPYVSTLVDYITIFFDHFADKGICNNFASVEEFHYSLSQYHKVRNILSHPASRQILITDFNTVIVFIKKISDYLSDDYYWYVLKEDILRQINEIYKLLGNNPLTKDNLANINLQHRSLVCREDEIELIDASILGKDAYKRVAGSVVLFGYGGVGKTALIIDYIYKLIGKIVDNGNSFGIDFILFFSSKDEYLRLSNTTGDLYIDRTIRQIDSYSSFVDAIKSILEVDTIGQIAERYNRGIIIIDNLENIAQDEKDKIFDFIKSTPRSIQYVITSRNEEPCEEKIHVKEFRDIEKGKRFIHEFISAESLNIILPEDKIIQLIDTSKGNTLILVQSLLSIAQGVSSIDEIINSLDGVRSKKTEIIADFMYKNTFETAIYELESKGYNPKAVIIAISLYGEPIELYSISKLCNIDLGTSEIICHLLTTRLILIKKGEYYSLNEFANSFIFIKLLPDRFEISNIQSKIRNHKNRMFERIHDMDEQIAKNQKIRQIMDDWKPRNYIDKIVIAESFAMYSVVSGAVRRREHDKIRKAFNDYKEHEMVSNHPYIQFQKARLYKLALRIASGTDAKQYQTIIQRAYEDSIESIEFDYPYIQGTLSHGAVLMLLGIFLATEQNDYSRAIRFLEEAKDIFPSDDKNYYILRNYLALSFEEMYQKKKDSAYRHQLEKIVGEVRQNCNKINPNDFNTKLFLDTYGYYLH